MLEKESKLSLSKRCELLSLCRSGVYHKTQCNNYDAWLMNEIHELWHKYPFYGQRRIVVVLNSKGYVVNRKRIQRLMRLMNLKAIYPKRTTVSCRQHEKYPYLLADIDITHPDQVWATDITYIKMKKGFMYLVALIDLFSRYIISWELAISMDTEFCMSMLDEAFSKKKPNIINTDQGSQFTSNVWLECLKRNEVKISMDSKGRCLDNVYIERFWRSLKQEEVYLKPYDNVVEARAGISNYMKFYNHTRPHQSLGYN
jgi:putative transposase